MKQEKNNEENKLVSIIIPLWNTEIETFKRCLNSICKQDYKNIEVIVIDDHSDINYNNTIRFYSQSLNIKYFRFDFNFGPGLARKKGLELAEGEYITFIDSDDELYDNTSIKVLYKEIKADNTLNMVSGLAFEELKDGSTIKREKNFIWVFGKLFKRSFLISNNITFNSTRANEDNAFTTLFRMLTDKYKFLDKVVYIWHYNETSITRKNGHEYYFWSIEYYVKNMIWVYDECKNRGVEKGQRQLAHFTNVWIRLYFYCIEVLYDREAEDVNKLSKWAINYYNSVYKHIEHLISPDFFMDCWKLMVGSSPETFIERIINISYPEFYNIISSNELLIQE